MPDLFLETNPPDLAPAPNLLGGGYDYSVGDLVTIEADPTALGDEGETLNFERWTVEQVLGSLGDFSLDTPTSFLQTFYFPNVSQFRIVANYTPDETFDPDTDEWPVTFLRNVTNIGDDVPDNLEDIIEERFGVITMAQSEFLDIDIPFPQTTNWIVNHQSFLEGEPVIVGTWFEQGYEFERWYQHDTLIGAEDGFENHYNYSSAFSFDMVDDQVYLQLDIKAVGPFNLTVSRNNGTAGSVTGGGQYQTITSVPFVPSVVAVEAFVNYGYEFVEWVGDIEFIADGYTVNDASIEVNVMTNISLEAIFQETAEQEVFVEEQSVGPYTDNIDDSETRTVFQPKRGRNLTVLNPEFLENNSSSSIVEELDGRFPLGTYTLNNRDFWENLTYDRISNGSQIDSKRFDGEVETAYGNLINTPDGPTITTEQTNYFSVETLPYVKNPNTDQVIPLNEYYDKEIHFWVKLKLDVKDTCLRSHFLVDNYPLPKKEGEV